MLKKLKVFFVELVKDNQSPKKRKKKKEKEPTMTVLKDRFPDYVGKDDLNDKLPLNQGDFMILKNGRKYKVCKRTLTGAITKTTVSLQWVNKPKDVTQETHVESMRFGSLRELNYYIDQEKSSIEDVVKNEENPYTSQLNIQECHYLALQENEKRDKVKNFFVSSQNK